MGSGASLDGSASTATLSTGLTAAVTEFYCHQCRLLFNSTVNTSNPDISCIYCSSTFVEDVSRFSDHRRTVPRLRNLTVEQNRRITSASIMLRILEEQLREELELLQNNYSNFVTNFSNESKPKPITSNMFHKLRNRKDLTLDMLCSLPSCPICTEDFQTTSEVTQMQCNHFCHTPCLLPWLEAKRTCPICRFELSDHPITFSELMVLSEDEIKEKITLLNVDKKVVELYDENTSKTDLVLILKDLIDKESEQESDDFNIHSAPSNEAISNSNASSTITSENNPSSTMPRPTYIIRSTDSGVYLTSAVPRSMTTQPTINTTTRVTTNLSTNSSSSDSSTEESTNSNRRRESDNSHVTLGILTITTRYFSNSS